MTQDPAGLIDSVTKEIESGTRRFIFTSALTREDVDVISKEAIQSAGHQFAGHTEIFATYTGTLNYAMLLFDEKFSVIHVSTRSKSVV